MTNTNINQQIHEILGLCWHEMKGGTIRPASCIHDCGLRMSIAEWQLLSDAINPDYCSDLNRVARVEHKILDMDLGDKYITALCEAVLVDTTRWNNANEGWRKALLTDDDAFMVATASPKDRCLALIAAEIDRIQRREADQSGEAE